MFEDDDDDIPIVKEIEYIPSPEKSKKDKKKDKKKEKSRSRNHTPEKPSHSDDD